MKAACYSYDLEISFISKFRPYPFKNILQCSIQVIVAGGGAARIAVGSAGGGAVVGGGVAGESHTEQAARKREVRLMKNREAARECRNKKKEYIKCLENRVAVLENQNKALIEELKSLKELYTGQKS